MVTPEQAHRVLLALPDSVTARMRADGVKSFCVAVSIRSNDFKTRSHQRRLPEATDISSEVYRLCRQLFAELWDGHTPLRLIGVALTDLTKERSRKLDAAYDSINKKFGSATIQRGSSMQSKLDVVRKYRAQLELKREKTDKKG